MGGGRKPRSLGNVVIKPPRIKPALLSTGSGVAVGAGGSEAVDQLDCQTFDIEKTKAAVRNVKEGAPVYGAIVGRNVEVRHKELGTLGFVPPINAGLIIKAGRNRNWAGQILGVDVDRLSVKVKLCPS